MTKKKQATTTKKAPRRRSAAPPTTPGGTPVRRQAGEDIVTVPVANIAALNSSFVSALTRSPTPTDVDGIIRQKITRELVAGGASASVKLTLAVRNQIDLLNKLTGVLLEAVETRSGEFLEEASGADFVERVNMLSQVVARLGKSVVEFREMRLMIDALRKLVDDIEEPEAAGLSESSGETRDMAKKIAENPSALFRMMNVLRYVRGGGEALDAKLPPETPITIEAEEDPLDEE